MATFDPDQIERLGWRQGAVLGSELAVEARARAPTWVALKDRDWLIVTSHDCDVVGRSLEKEPFAELLRAVVVQQKAPDKQQEGGRNPRTLQFDVDVGSATVVLSCKVHERWSLPRELLMNAAPSSVLPDKQRRLIAEWLAKRYIRAAFPTAFDLRWRSKLKNWTGLLQRKSGWVQGVYLRLNTLTELESTQEYRCHLIVAVPVKMKPEPGWATKRDEIEREFSAFWKQFSPGIAFDGVEVLGTDEVTLADIEFYQRFDADWVSYADDTPTTPAAADMPS